MHSFVSLLVHVVFSTKDRRPVLTPEIQSRLWPYLGGIARNQKIKALVIGGIADHIHMLLSLAATQDVASVVQILKGNSSKWIHSEFREQSAFEWQKGYGAFTIGISGVDETIAYIANQAEHHRRKSFREEFENILKRHGITYEGWMLD